MEAYIGAVRDGHRDARRPWAIPDHADIADEKRFREARKGVRVAEKALRRAREAERQAARDARDRAGRR